jgi:tRNA(Arg) A34 adenosine deaminase TadA
VNREALDEAVRLSLQAIEQGTGGPFGAVVVKNGRIIGRGQNSVLSTHDPTAHAEIMAIREACRALKSFWLDGCQLYTSSEPCPMCLAAAYWARIAEIWYANTIADAAAIGFSDAFIYEELATRKADRTMKLHRVEHPGARAAFAQWAAKPDKVRY